MSVRRSAAVLVLALAVRCGAAPAVAVGLPPQAGILRALAPDATPLVLVDRGQNPHSFDPSPRQLAGLSRAALYVCSGLPFEKALRSRLRALNPTMRFVEAPADDDPADDDHDHGDEGHDPHFWTHPDGLLAEARAIAAALAEADPDAAPALEGSAEAYARRIRETDARIRERLAPLRGRAFLVYHPAWSHFAEAYGLRQLAVERHGAAPSARQLAALVDTVRAEGIRAILVQSESEAARAAPLARTLSLEVLRVNALAPDPLAQLDAAAAAVEAALRPRPATAPSTTLLPP